jgi:hypothetical protein
MDDIMIDGIMKFNDVSNSMSLLSSIIPNIKRIVKIIYNEKIIKDKRVTLQIQDFFLQMRAI